MMATSCSNTQFNFDDVVGIGMAVFVIWFVVHQFKTGEASGRGGSVKRNEQPRRFKFMMACYVFLAVLFTLVALLDVYARIYHHPRCG